MNTSLRYCICVLGALFAPALAFAAIISLPLTLQMRSQGEIAIYGIPVLIGFAFIAWLPLKKETRFWLGVAYLPAMFVTLGIGFYAVACMFGSSC